MCNYNLYRSIFISPQHRLVIQSLKFINRQSIRGEKGKYTSTRKESKMCSGKTADNRTTRTSLWKRTSWECKRIQLQEHQQVLIESICCWIPRWGVVNFFIRLSWEMGFKPTLSLSRWPANTSAAAETVEGVLTLIHLPHFSTHTNLQAVEPFASSPFQMYFECLSSPKGLYTH